MILPLKYVPVVRISCQHGRVVEVFSSWSSTEKVLPDPKGSLSEKVPSSSITLANDIIWDSWREATWQTWRVFKFNSCPKVFNRQACSRKWVTATIHYPYHGLGLGNNHETKIIDCPNPMIIIPLKILQYVACENRAYLHKLHHFRLLVFSQELHMINEFSKFHKIHYWFLNICWKLQYYI